MEAVALSRMAFVEHLARELSGDQLELPSFPDAAERVRRALDDPDCAADRLAKIIGTDAGLTGQIVRMANSSAYNARGTQISSLQVAIGRLGQDTIRSAAVAMAMRQLAHASATPALKEPLGRFWKHSVQVAAVAYTLATRVPHINQDEAMLAGLVHDIGELYILKRAAEQPELLADAFALSELIEHWHTGIGHAIVEAWGFPESVVKAVSEHEELERDIGDVASSVLVANLLAKREAGELQEMDWEQVPAFGKLGLTLENRDEVLRASRDEIQSIVGALKN